MVLIEPAQYAILSKGAAFDDQFQGSGLLVYSQHWTAVWGHVSCLMQVEGLIPVAC